MPQIAERVRLASTTFLTAFGQVMLQRSWFAGALFVVAIASNSWSMLFGAMLGNIAAHAGAWMLHRDREDVADGVFGFNGVLVGIAVLFYHAPSVTSVSLIVVASVLSSWALHLFQTWGRVPAYTAPFVLTTWAALLVAAYLGLAPSVDVDSALQAGVLTGVARGIGQVWFQDSWLSGVILLAGLLVSSRQAALWSVFGSAVGLMLARLLGYPGDLIAAGVFGFNGVLAGIALASRYPTSIARPLAGIVFSVFLTRAFQLTGIPALTAPFVLATWLVILAARFGPGRSSAEGASWRT